MTLRLVEKTASKLDETETRQLFDQVRSWEHSDKDFFAGMLESQRQLKGDQWPDNKTRSRQNRVTANLAFAMFKSSVPFIFFKEPTVRTRPKNPLQVGKDVIWDGIFNGTLPLIDYAKQKRMQVEDAWVYGEGWSKWVVSPQEDGNQKKTLLTEVPKGPAKWHGKGLPVSLRLTPRQVIVDSEARGRDPDEARAIAIKYRRPLNEVLADKRYTISKKKFLRDKRHKGGDQGKAAFQEHMRARLDDFFDEDTIVRSRNQSLEEMITIYEVWVYQLVDYKLFRQVVTLMEDYPLPIMQPREWSDFIGENFPGWPIRKMEFNRIPDDRPTNNIQITKNLQQTFNWVLSKLVNHIDTLNTVRTVDNSAVKDVKKTMRQLRRGGSLEYVEVTGTDAIQNVATPPFPADAYNLATILEGLIDHIGPGSKARGGQPSARTATEANIVEQSLKTLDDDTVDIVKKFLIEDIEQLGEMLLGIMDPDQILKIAGDTGGAEFGRIDNDTLLSVPEVEIDIDSFRKISIQEKLQPWTTLWSLAIQAIAIIPDLRIDVILARISMVLGVDPGTFMGNLEDERLDELMAIMTLVQLASEVGQDADIPIPPKANAIVRLQVLDFFLASPVAKRMGNGVLAVLNNRRIKLMQLVDAIRDQVTQVQSAGSQANIGQNPLDKPLGGNGTNAPDAATRARADTQTALRSGGNQPGTRGTPG